jgi:hypothetical protein
MGAHENDSPRIAATREQRTVDPKTAKRKDPCGRGSCKVRRTFGLGKGTAMNRSECVRCSQLFGLAFTRYDG